MVFPISCVEDFYHNPDEVLEYALSLEYGKYGIYPGYRTKPLHTLNKNFFDEFCSKLFSLFFDYQYCNVNWVVTTAFQKTCHFYDKTDSVLNSGWIHLDSSCVAAGVIYLNKKSNLESGTTLYRPKYKDLYKKCLSDRTDYGDYSPRIKFYANESIDIEEYKKRKLEHESLFEKTLEFNNVYNRLIMFDSSCWHKESSFIANEFEPRLTQVFFIKSIEAKSFPINRKNNYEI